MSYLTPLLINKNEEPYLKETINKYQERDTEHQQLYHFLPEKLKHKSAKPTFVRANIILPALMKRPAENESQKPLEQYKNSWANTATSDVN